MILKTKYLLGILLLLFVISAKGQKSFDLELFSYSGAEHNIFKAPDVLFNPVENVYFENDSFIANSIFIEGGYDTRYQWRKKDRYRIQVGSDFWHRRYASYSQANQTQWEAFLNAQKYFGEKLFIEPQYTFAYKDKLGTSISGDELLRSFKYRSHEGNVQAVYEVSKKFTTAPEFNITYNNYFADTTSKPLTYLQYDFNAQNEYSLSKKHALIATIGFRQRNYLEYPASDSLGITLPIAVTPLDSGVTSTVLRKYRYLDFELLYEWRPRKGIVVKPEFSLFRRDDLFQAYYSYKGFGSQVSTMVKNDKWYFYFYANYRYVQYLNRMAFTYLESRTPLKYQYVDFKVKARRELGEKLELFGSAVVDIRKSNTELDYSITRRSYRNFEFLFGLNYLIFD